MLLYKYLPPTRLELLAEKRIRFTQPVLFNDPFEGSPVLHDDGVPNEWINLSTLIGSTTRSEPPYSSMRAAAASDAIQARYPAAVSLLQAMMVDTVGVLSLSQRRESLLMWAHYADSHKGYLVGFDSSHPYFNRTTAPEPKVGELAPVRYLAARPTRGLRQATVADWLFTKSVQWAYEEEWRMFMEADAAQATIQQERAPPLMLYGFPADAVREVVLGCRMERIRRARILEILADDSYRHVEVLAGSPSQAEYSL